MPTDPTTDGLREALKEAWLSWLHSRAVPATRSDLVDTVISGFDGDYPSTATLLRTIRALASSPPAEGSGGDEPVEAEVWPSALYSEAVKVLMCWDAASASSKNTRAVNHHLLDEAITRLRGVVEAMRRGEQSERTRGCASDMLEILRAQSADMRKELAARDKRIAEMERDAYEDEVAVDALCDAAGGADNVGSAVDWCLRTKERIATLESDLATTRAAHEAEVRELRRGRDAEREERARVERWYQQAVDEKRSLESRLAAMQAVVDAVEDWGCADITAVGQLRADANYCDVEGMNGLADRLRRLADALAALPAADAEATDPEVERLTAEMQRIGRNIERGLIGQPPLPGDEDPAIPPTPASDGAGSAQPVALAGDSVTRAEVTERDIDRLATSRTGPVSPMVTRAEVERLVEEGVRRALLQVADIASGAVSWSGRERMSQLDRLAADLRAAATAGDKPEAPADRKDDHAAK